MKISRYASVSSIHFTLPSSFSYIYIFAITIVSA